MNILAFELSSTHGTLALATSNGVEQINMAESRQQVRQILPMVQTLLSHANLGVHDLQGIAYSAGPGSFTGIRLAAGTAQGLAMPHDIPLLSVSSLQVLAQTALRTQGCQDVFCLNNAFMGEVYGAHYVDHQGMMELMGKELLSSPMNIVMPGSMERVIGDAHLTYSTELSSLFNYTTLYPEAVDLLSIAQAKLPFFQAPTQLFFNYIRDESAWRKNTLPSVDKHSI